MNMALSLWVTDDPHVLVCLKQWSYNNTQLPNDQIRSTWCIATRGNVSYTCSLTVFETIWSCRENMKTMPPKHAFWQYLKRFRTADFLLLKTMPLKHELWRYLKRFGTEEIVLKTMFLKHAFWRYWNRFGTEEKRLKTMSLKHAFWWYFKRFGTAKKWKQWW